MGQVIVSCKPLSLNIADILGSARVLKPLMDGGVPKMLEIVSQQLGTVVCQGETVSLWSKKSPCNIIDVRGIDGRELFAVASDGHVTLSESLGMADVARLPMWSLLAMREIINTAIYDQEHGPKQV